ncbi:MAG: hypothetical protein RMI56_00355 [Sulfolobales archaeon]|nr:hypothetical protein [Sulfolobales archaeon]MDW8082231.1 hypothetical protein [Sulfolobales archaeon]
MSSRRFVALPEKLLSEAVKIAEKLGIPYTVLIERILSEVLQVLKHKKNLLESLSAVDAFDDIRKLGGVILPASVAREILKGLDRESMSRVCRELDRVAAWYAELGKVKRSVNPTEIGTSLTLWIPGANVDVVREGEKNYKFVVSSVNFTEELLELSRCIAEGLIRGYGLDSYELHTEPSVLVLRVGGLGEE